MAHTEKPVRSERETAKELEKIRRGCEEILPSEEALALLLRRKSVLRVKFGVDPTSKDLHIGHAVPLWKLRDFQELGHKVIFLIGDFTARVGDPTGQKETRPPLSEAEIKENAETYFDQVKLILDPKKTEIRYNSEWLAKLTLAEIHKMASSITVARLLERDDFSIRFKKHDPIHLHELMYCLLVAYDSVMLESDIELGATEQKFNLLMGRQLQELYGQPQQVVITMPILEGTDGKVKMSKSVGNYIGISESPKDIFGKTMSIPDELIIKYMRLATDLDEDEIRRYETSLAPRHSPPKTPDSRTEAPPGALNPMDAKLALAQAIVARYYGDEIAREERENFIEAFSLRSPEALAEDRIWTGPKEVTLVNLLMEIGAAPSKREARRVIQQGGVLINGERATDPEAIITVTSGTLIAYGKKRFYRLRLPT